MQLVATTGDPQARVAPAAAAATAAPLLFPIAADSYVRALTSACDGGEDDRHLLVPLYEYIRRFLDLDEDLGSGGGGGGGGGGDGGGAASSASSDEFGDSANAGYGSGGVAIDNKIEQAMDLVKSHLMFAVREEVEVLKETISELKERISDLEHENGILRAHANPDTLALVQSAKAAFVRAPAAASFSTTASTSVTQSTSAIFTKTVGQEETQGKEGDADVDGEDDLPMSLMVPSRE